MSDIWLNNYYNNYNNHIAMMFIAMVVTFIIIIVVVVRDSDRVEEVPDVYAVTHKEYVSIERNGITTWKLEETIKEDYTPEDWNTYKEISKAVSTSQVYIGDNGMVVTVYYANNTRKSITTAK